MMIDLTTCGPMVAPETIAAVIRVESGGDALAIGANGGPKVRRPGNAADAVHLARGAMIQSRSVDLGLMQVNSRNLAALGYHVAQMFDPCTNVRAGTTILAADYAAAVARMGPGQAALRVALSLYNSGDYERGFANGYVARYYGAAVVGAGRARVPRLLGVPPRKAADPFTSDIEVYTRKEARNGPTPTATPVAAQAAN